MKRDSRETLEEVVKKLRRASGGECTCDLCETMRTAARELGRVLEAEDHATVLLHGRIVEPAVADAIRRYKRDPAVAEAILRGDEPYRLRYDAICNCYLFEDHGMTVGVELDGHLHT